MVAKTYELRGPFRIVRVLSVLFEEGLNEGHKIFGDLLRIARDKKLHTGFLFHH